MEKITQENKKITFITTYLTAYFLISLLFLAQFPTMHSDESWLSGLTRSMMNGGIASTESFFDLLPRYPHAIKTIFHLLQMLFITILGYNLFAVRLLSLIFGIICLTFFYKLATLFVNKKLATRLTLVLSLDIQFIYTSHFARQEIIILTAMLGGVYYVLSNCSTWKIRHDLITAAIVGLSIGIHPNSFVIALVIGSLYLYHIFVEKKLKLTNLLVLISGVIVFASIFVGLSFLFNDTFIHDYLTYGETLGVTNTSINKFKGLLGYYQRLFSSTSVTYYTPFIKFQFSLFVVSVLGSLITIISSEKRNNLIKILLPLLAINIGFIIIGRYSQPGIIFIFPFGYLLSVVLLNQLFLKKQLIAKSLLVIIFINSIIGITPYLNHHYKTYLDEIKSRVPSNTTVLANLNTEYAFDYGKLYDYRNLDYLKTSKLSFADYIKQREIEIIIYPEEMDYIYNNRPVWNVMYGNVYPYYDDMQTFLNEQCTLIDTFYSPYAMRIMTFAHTKDWSVKIYRVKYLNTSPCYVPQEK